ncbi:ribonuclease N [Streptomyces sp. J2-1]|uniref:ribonuclease domain-containing protein n=1 Tax=Streptomyces corallincola TaxID=2851888 RepID=UPI001C38676E|nr:ribonuclease domain-containing protein [Streptomyces corallincola]MBV2354519.1 ribonuclease N [Streptomyces corallincola]
MPPTPSAPARPRLLAALLLCLLALLTGCTTGTGGDGAADGTTTGSPTTATAPPATAATPSWAEGMATVPETRLPAEALRTLVLIDRGGPYPYARDGVVFGNFERLLPREPRGYYHEYTVPTPGSRDRGARRIVTGRDREFYYTDDHYKSFRAVLR